jgi:hypothetical protein
MLALLAGVGSAHAQAGVVGGDLPPAGYGTLSQDDINLTFVAGDLQVRFLPLDERILRLLGGDAYASLHGLVASRKPVLDSIAARNGSTTPGYALVSFFALRPDASYDPDNLMVTVRSQLYRPIGLVPFTANFNARRLGVRQAATAIYVIEQPLPVFESFTVAYGTNSADWQDLLPRIERERSRVVARFQSPSDSAKP